MLLEGRDLDVAINPRIRHALIVDWAASFVTLTVVGALVVRADTFVNGRDLGLPVPQIVNGPV